MGQVPSILRLLNMCLSNLAAEVVTRFSLLILLFILLVARISEERFWRNYFYRVSLIKQSTQLTSLAATGMNKKYDVSG